MASKICSRCGLNKPLSRFGKRKLKSGWKPKSSCNQCQVEISEIWRQKNLDRCKNNHLKRNYGITLETFNLLREKQRYSCAICRKSEEKATRGSLHVDHCHSTGKVRGLLCVECNTVLGKVQDNPLILEAMIGYLKG